MNGQLHVTKKNQSRLRCWSSPCRYGWYENTVERHLFTLQGTHPVFKTLRASGCKVARNCCISGSLSLRTFNLYSHKTLTLLTPVGSCGVENKGIERSRKYDPVWPPFSCTLPSSTSMQRLWLLQTMYVWWTRRAILCGCERWIDCCSRRNQRRIDRI